MVTQGLRSSTQRIFSVAKAMDDPKALAQALADRSWSKGVSFGLAADLRELPDPRKARIPVLMEACESPSFHGFEDELGRVQGDDALEVGNRIRMCEGDVQQLFVASDDQGEPIYAQWLIDSSNQRALHEVVPQLFPDLGEDETLVEGAYTFVNFRRTGAMADGMHQLLALAASRGARRCFTYVAAGNAPSLKGCARVGFQLDHVRLAMRRLGRRSVVRRAPEAGEREFWNEAVKPSS